MENIYKLAHGDIIKLVIFLILNNFDLCSLVRFRIFGYEILTIMKKPIDIELRD